MDSAHPQESPLARLLARLMILPPGLAADAPAPAGSPASPAAREGGRYDPAPSAQTPAQPSATNPASSMAVTAAPPSLLVVDDEPELRGLLAEYFSRHGFAVGTAADAAEARVRIHATRPDLAVLDINMPGENGLSLARWLREAHPGVAIVMLTTASEPVDRIVGLELGADDYVSKPYELRELLARVRAVLRRSRQPAGAAAGAAAGEPAAMQVAFGECQLDLDQRKLRAADGAEIEITAAEFDLLALFARNPNRPLNRDQIMEQAHNRGWDVFDRSIDLRVMRLRRKIERNPDKPEVLKTVRNVGYVFVPSSR
jgi:DNA-binding response OmpR family regulator